MMRGSSIVGVASQPGHLVCFRDGHRVAADNTERGPTAEHQGNGATSAIGVTV